MSDKNIFDGIVLIQGGKIVVEPVADNYQVHPQAGSVIVGDPQPILKALRERYPKCAFVWFSDPIKVGPGVPAESSAPPPANEPPSVVEPPAAAESQPDLADPPPAADPPAPGKTRKPKKEA